MDKFEKVKAELQSRERELARSGELIAALQEAHKKALERSNNLSQQLENLKQNQTTLKKELEITYEREATERREKNEVRRLHVIIEITLSVCTQLFK